MNKYEVIVALRCVVRAESAASAAATATHVAPYVHGVATNDLLPPAAPAVESAALVSVTVNGGHKKGEVTR